MVILERFQAQGDRDRRGRPSSLGFWRAKSNADSESKTRRHQRDGKCEG